MRIHWLLDVKHLFAPRKELYHHHHHHVKRLSIGVSGVLHVPYGKRVLLGLTFFLFKMAMQ